MTENNIVRGIIMSKAYTLYDVFAGGDIYKCVLPGRMLEKAHGAKSNLIVVGDEVHIKIINKDSMEGVIEEILPRKSKLSRPSPHDKSGLSEQIIVANLDQIVIVVSTMHPPIKPGLIDRYLAAAEFLELTPVVCINKIDLVEPDLIKRILAPYRALGYECHEVCAINKTGIEPVMEKLHGKTSVIAGHSGVGKSSLLNAIQPDLKLKTGNISAWHDKGKHTTSAISLMPLAIGGFVVDTPGIREFGLWGITQENLAFYFTEFRPFIDDCKFSPCSHLHEPSCAIKAALADGKISAERYESYVRIYESLSSGRWDGQ